MGRPEKLSKEEQIMAVELSKETSRKNACATYKISDLTLRRYEKNAKLESGQESGQPEAA